ncbi:MAG: PH domain-containing protein [Planctomycetota bacterium]|nr:PH domain-containing protein [Planctomycetota bacterium]
MTSSGTRDEFHNETVIAEAKFRKLDIITYQIASTSIIVAITIVAIPLLLIAIPLIKVIYPKIVDTWECTLTNRAVHVKKGLFVKVKKTIPLEKITDVGSVQGPIMRRFGLHALSFETAGQSGAGTSGALVKLLGIEDSEAFRDLVLDTRDAANQGQVNTPAAVAKPASDDQLLRDIRDSLLRIEDRMNQSD